MGTVGTGATSRVVYVAEGTGRESDRKESLDSDTPGNLLEGVGGVRCSLGIVSGVVDILEFDLSEIFILLSATW